MMKKLMISLLSLLAITVAQAQLLWKIEYPGAHPSYVLGTCHLVDIDYVDSIPGFFEAFAACDTLYTEIGIPEAGRMQTAMADMYARLVRQPPLGRVLSPATAGALSRYIAGKDGGADSASAAEDLRRYNIAELLVRYPEMELFGPVQDMVPSEPMDPGLVRLARGTGIKDLALESVEYQIDLLCNFVCSNMEEAIRGMVESDSASEAVRIIDMYRRGELDGLYGELEKYRGFDNLSGLLDDRNRLWAVKLARSMREGGGVFVAVGAGHLPGDDGLLELLRREGLKVSR